MSEFYDLNRTQKQHLDAVDTLWSEYGPLLQRRRELVGGMQWKTIRGRQYLYRYAPDPITRAKRSTSLGPKSPETEAIHDEFLTARDDTLSRISELGQEAEMLARMSKALRLGRVRENIVTALSAIWAEGQADALLLSGMGAIPSYEHICRASTGSLPELLPIEIFVGNTRVDDIVDDVLVALRRADKGYVYMPRRNAFVGTKGPDIALVTAHTILERLDEWGADDDAAEIVLKCYREKPLFSMLMANSGNVAPVYSIDPRAWLALHMSRAHFDQELFMDEREDLLELGRKVWALSEKIGLELSPELLDAPFMSSVFNDDGGLSMKI